jgi:hypothetical protein
MKTIASFAFGLACAVGASFGAASVASVVVSAPNNASRMNIAASDLWTTAPVKIDRAAQSFERLPVALSTYALSPVPISKPAPQGKQKIEWPIETSDNAASFSSDHLN